MLVAGCEFACDGSIALGIEQAHGVFGEVAAVGDLRFVMQVREDGAEVADGGVLVGEDPHDP